MLHLRTVLPSELQLSLVQIEHIENIGSGSFGKVFKVNTMDNIYQRNLFMSLAKGKLMNYMCMSSWTIHLLPRRVATLMVRKPAIRYSDSS